LTYWVFEFAHNDTVRKAGVSLNRDRLAGRGLAGACQPQRAL